jgi:hypothetical protein
MNVLNIPCWKGELRPIRAIIIDDDPRPDDKDPGAIVGWFEVYGWKMEVVAHTRQVSRVQYIDADLLVIDYGGLSFGYGDGWTLAHYEVRRACEWAENHPGKLMVIWTAHTARLYSDELNDAFGHLDNIIVRYHDFGPRGDADEVAMWAKIEQWLGK